MKKMDSSHPIAEEGMNRSQLAPPPSDKKTNSNTVTSKLTSHLPTFRRTSLERHQRNQSVNRTIDVAEHQDKSTRFREEREQETLQNMIKRMQRIEKSRLEVQERIEKEVEVARKTRLKR